MRYYPIQLDIQNKKVVVVGGGTVAYQKITTLLKAGAQLWVISPILHPDLQKLWHQSKIQWKEKFYESGDLEGATLAFGATNNTEVNQQIHQEALQKKIFFNAVDQPQECDFIVPAHLERGALMVTFSTSGDLPWFSKKLRQKLEAEWGEEYGEFLEWAKPLRKRYSAPDEKKKFIYFLEENEKEILNYFKEKRTSELSRKLHSYMSPHPAPLPTGERVGERGKKNQS